MYGIGMSVMCEYDYVMTLIIFLVFISSIVGCIAAYYNGVNDGCGASLEPWNQGYYKAKRYLVKNTRFKHYFRHTQDIDEKG